MLEVGDKSLKVESKIPEEKVKIGTFNALINQGKHCAKILQPQEFSISLRKLLCLTEELFQSCCTSNVLILNKFEKKYKMKEEHDQYLMVMQGVI